MRTPHFLGVKALQTPAKSQILERDPLTRCTMAMAYSLQGPGGLWQAAGGLWQAAFIILTVLTATNDFSSRFLEQVADCGEGPLWEGLLLTPTALV